MPMEIDITHWIGLDYLFNANKRLYWPYLLCALAIGWIYVRAHGQSRDRYLSTQIWWHRSARLDYQYFVISNLIKISLIYPFLINANDITLTTIKFLEANIGFQENFHPPTEMTLLAYTASLFLVGDFTRYCLHRLMHRIPMLWEIHKVHHSAEVLTPITLYRVHPLENLLFGLRYAISSGLVTGIFIYIFGAGLSVLNILGVNVFIAGAHMLGDNLRHSPIRLTYPVFLERWIISPAQHQFHHCKSGNQFNYGGVLAVWDRLFNSLRHAQINDSYEFGLGQKQSHPGYDNVFDLLLKPLQAINEKWNPFQLTTKNLRVISLALIGLMTASPLVANNNRQQTISELGGTLYFDKNLSFNRRQSCASCHNPDAGFIDNRENIVGSAASFGDDEQSIGDRIAPAIAYVSQTPSFHYDEKKQAYIGGQFWDGRAKNLVEQAKGPFLNPLEMGMPNAALLVSRLQESDDYIHSFQNIFGEDVFDDTEQAFEAIAKSIASFENTELFQPFDSKYDRYLHGEYDLTDEEDLGMSIFFSTTNSNCSSCHVLKVMNDEGEPFSNYEYHNIGVPLNQRLRENNGLGKNYRDNGLLMNPEVSAVSEKGKFKVPGLRNIAITAPYMHNGVFRNLRTVIEFYDQYNNSSRNINPETGLPWQKAEINENIALDELKAKKLSDRKINALIAFLKTLTDRRYEYLLKD